MIASTLSKMNLRLPSGRELPVQVAYCPACGAPRFFAEAFVPSEGDLVECVNLGFYETNTTSIPRCEARFTISKETIN